MMIDVHSPMPVNIDPLLIVFAVVVVIVLVESSFLWNNQFDNYPWTNSCWLLVGSEAAVVVVVVVLTVDLLTLMELIF